MCPLTPIMAFVTLIDGSGEHVGYWQQYPGNYEHWRFADGFTGGWNDAYLFSTLGAQGAHAEEIGFVGPWKKRRVREHIQEKGNNSIWEFGTSYTRW